MLENVTRIVMAVSLIRSFAHAQYGQFLPNIAVSVLRTIDTVIKVLGPLGRIQLVAKHAWCLGQ